MSDKKNPEEQESDVDNFLGCVILAMYLLLPFVIMGILSQCSHQILPR